MDLLTIRRTRRLLAPAFAASLALLAGCGVHLGMGVEAQDTWSRAYTVTTGATLVVQTTNGRVHITAGDGDQIKVEATRVARGATEEAAKAALGEIAIVETASPDRVELDASSKGLQVVLGQSKTVHFNITVPRSVHVALKATNGDIDLDGVGGSVKVEGTNGRVAGRRLAQGVDVTTVNGVIALELDDVAAAGVRCRTTNGRINLTLPANAKATLAGRVTNGVVRTEGLALTTTEESRRRLDATIGGGGPEVRLETTNGEIRISGR